MHKWFIAALLAGAASVAQAQDSGSHAGHAGHIPAVERPPLRPGNGNGGFAVGTANAEAQAYFNNGIELAYAFEHEAAKAAFKESVRLDPQCVMCAWGVAWSAGPTINYNVTGDDLKTAQSSAAAAQKLAKARGDAFERQMADALVARYKKGGGWGSKGDKAFLAHMKKIATAYPDRDMVQVITADAVLNAANYDDGPEAWKAAVTPSMSYLTTVLARDPDNTAAIHLYIHAAEMTDVPAYAEVYADRLMRLAPQSQHLVHMPSHIYFWVGRYRDAGLANLKAVNLGRDLAATMAKPPEDAPFSIPYHTHNVHFGLGGALMAGDGETALAIARPLVAAATNPKFKSFDNPMRQHLAGKGLTAIALYAPDEILNSKEPTGSLLASYWHYARGEALAAKGDAAGVRAEAAAMTLPPIAKKEKDDDGSWIGATILAIGHHVLEGRAAVIEKRYPDALAAFEKAAALEEAPEFSRMVDPPFWWYPVRRSIVEMKLKMGDVAGAKTEAEATLKRRPKDPGSLEILKIIEM